MSEQKETPLSARKPLSSRAQQLFKHFTNELRDKFAGKEIPVEMAPTMNEALQSHNEETAIALAEAEARASHDSLTGLLNKHGIEEVLKADLAVYHRNAYSDKFTKPIAVLLLDGDNFKIINDTKGHKEGDNAIKAIAESIKLYASRPLDNTGRTGGDEFLVILPETDLKGALFVAEGIRENVTRNAQNNLFSNLSVSIGIALYQGNCNQTELINNADQAMYQAKKTSGNKIAIHSESLPKDPQELAELNQFIKEKNIKANTNSVESPAMALTAS